MDTDSTVLGKKVVFTPSLLDEIKSLYNKYNFKIILIGNSKKGKDIDKQLNSSNIKSEIIFVDETNSTLEARKLYWQENKPKGFWRLIPESLRLPPVHYDDYAAIVIGNRYINAR